MDRKLDDLLVSVDEWTQWMKWVGSDLSPESCVIASISLLLVANLAIIFSANSTKFTKMLIYPSTLLFAGLSICLYISSINSAAQNGLIPGLSDRHATPTGNTAPRFTIPVEATWGANVIPNIKDPEAVDPQSVCPGYSVSNVRSTSHGLTADLDLSGNACSVYGNDIPNLSLSVEYQASDRLHVEIKPRYIGPENETWFLLPEELIPKPDSGDEDGGEADSDLRFDWEEQPTFSFTISRKSTGEAIFSTKGRKLVFEDQFLEFGSSLPRDYNLYGLGETIHEFRLGQSLTRTLFNADDGDTIDANLYGSHPIYLDTRYYKANSASGERLYASDDSDPSADYTSSTHGVFLRNAHAQEILLRESGVTWRTLGGTIDLYFYAGPTAAGVIRSYQLSTVGLPAMQQYFAFGYHQCRWGYTGWKELQDIVDSFAAFEIPLETIWADIDYMNQYRDFDNDKNSWGYDEGAQFISRLHENGQHFVPIVDSAIYAPNPENKSDAYETFERGLDADAFLLNPDGSLYIGAVWPGYTVFPDWVGAVLGSSKTINWWIEELQTWHKKVPFDGIWIDMSEVASFCVGSCGTGNLTLNPVHPPFPLFGDPGIAITDYPEGFERTNSSEAASASSLASSLATTTTIEMNTAPYQRSTPTPGTRNVNLPPYVINNIQGALPVKAVSPNATHHGGSLEYDFHNLFGHQILNATYNALLSVFPGKRPFIIGRSTFAGSGRLAGHWGGDNYALWAYMYFSIPQALSFSLFGIPFFGADVCGFTGNTDLELCSRWMQLGAFIPFFRNHNNLGPIPQEPYRWAAVAEASRTAMTIRYSLLPYLYTVLHRAHTQGDTLMRALAWEFPHEPWLASADRQFLLGAALMVIPCLEQGATTVNGVFPGVGRGEIWYDWYDKSPVTNVARAENVTIPAPLGHIPLFVRGGHILPLQNPGLTTRASRQGAWGLLVPLDEKGTANGEIYIDDGESLQPNESLTIKLTAKPSSLTSTPTGSYTDTNPLGNITIMGLSSAVKTIIFQGEPIDVDKEFDADRGFLRVDLSSVTGRGVWDREWILEWE